MRQGVIGIIFLFSLLAPFMVRAETVELDLTHVPIVRVQTIGYIFTLKDFGLFAVSADAQTPYKEQVERTQALARDHKLKRITVIWYAPDDRYPDGDPLGTTMLEKNGQVAFSTTSAYGTRATRQGYVARLGYETTVDEITADVAKNAEAGCALYKGKIVDIRNARIDSVLEGKAVQNRDDGGISTVDAVYLYLKGKGGWHIVIDPQNASPWRDAEGKQLYSAAGRITNCDSGNKNIFLTGDIFFPVPPPPSP